MTAPGDDELLALLDHAFDGWGTPGYFEWKYDAYPGYDPDAHNFVVRVDGAVVAARRIFERTLQLPDGSSAVAHVHGGTAVHEDHRGNGYYTELLDHSRAYSDTHADYVFTFNRAGKITTEHHEKNGWHSLTLPVSLKLLSPSTVAASYLTDEWPVQMVANHTGRIDRALTRSPAVSRLLALAADAVSEDATVSASPRSDTPDSTPSPRVEIEAVAELSAAKADRLAASLAEQTAGTHSFGRSPATIRHAVSYPNATAYVATRDGSDRCGFAIAGHLSKGELTECRVLEQRWADAAVRDQLLDRIETDARAFGSDVLVACPRQPPGPGWVRLETEYMMWPDEGGPTALPTSTDEWRLSVYDIV